MNVTISETQTRRRSTRDSQSVVSEVKTAPSLDSVVRAICMDASYDSLKFVLRSDTGHDGE